MDLLITAFNILVLICIWNFGIKKSILDHHRDKLFRLRDEVREYFLANHSLEHPLYKELRCSINSKIAMTERMTLTRYITWTNAIINNAALREEIDRELTERFRCKSPELNLFISKFRGKSSDICLSYLIYSSFWLMALTLAIRAIYAVRMAMVKVFNHEWGNIFAREMADMVRRRPQEIYGESFKSTTLEETTVIAVC